MTPTAVHAVSSFLPKSLPQGLLYLTLMPASLLSKSSILQILPWNVHAYANSRHLNTIFHWACALQVFYTPNNAAVALEVLPPLSSLTSNTSYFQNKPQTLMRTNPCSRSWSLRGHNNQSLNHTTAPHTKTGFYILFLPLCLLTGILYYPKY